MLTLILYGLLALVVIAIVFLVITRMLPPGEQIAPALRDEPVWSLPGRRLEAAEIASVRLPIAWRGYRFSETDQLLDRLADELHERDVEIARLRGGPGLAAADPGPDPEADPDFGPPGPAPA